MSPDQEEPLSKEVTSSPKQSRPAVFYRGKGCTVCHQIGYYGRVGIFEWMDINDEIRNLVISKSPSSAIKSAAIRGGMRTLRDDGFDKARAGITTIEEVLRVTRES